MRFVIQRVTRAKVTVENEVTGEIGDGFAILCGISREDTEDDIDYLVAKTVNLRVFRAEDDSSGFDRSLADISGGVLLISQFTLYASTRKGRRPGFTEAAAPDVARPLFNRVIQSFEMLGVKVETGIFGAMMLVELVNDGPATFIIDSSDRHQPRR